MAFRLRCAPGACFILAALLQSPAGAAQPAATTPLTLERAIAAALLGNPELRSFEFQIHAQDARTRQAGLRPATELTLELENALGTGEYRGAESVEATLALSQLIELGGKREARIAAANAGRGVLDVERQARQLDVLAEVTRRFIEVASRQEHLRLTGTARDLAQQTIAATEKRVNAAKSPHAELDRAHIALDRAELAERRAAAGLDAARQQLAASWGESRPVIAGIPFGMVEANLYHLPPTGDYTELLGRLNASPDFLRFASEARLRDAELRLAASMRKPDLTLAGGVRRLQYSHDQALVASFSVPLFSGRRAESFMAEAQAHRDLLGTDQQIALVRAQATLFQLHQELSVA